MTKLQKEQLLFCFFFFSTLVLRESFLVNEASYSDCEWMDSVCVVSIQGLFATPETIKNQEKKVFVLFRETFCKP